MTQLKGVVQMNIKKVIVVTIIFSLVGCISNQTKTLKRSQLVGYNVVLLDQECIFNINNKCATGMYGKQNKSIIVATRGRTNQQIDCTKVHELLHHQEYEHVTSAGADKMWAELAKYNCPLNFEYN